MEEESTIKRASITAIVEEIDKNLSYLSTLTDSLIVKGHQLRDTTESVTTCGEPGKLEKRITLEEVLINHNNRLHYINSDLENLLQKLNGLF